MNKENELGVNSIFFNVTIRLQVHSGSVWRVTWAHPEFGQVLATCSFDRTASVLEELRK